MKFQFNHRYLLPLLLLFATEVAIALYGTPGSFLRSHFGDVLVVILIYCFLRAFFRFRTKWLAMYIFLFAVAVETGQYFHLVDRIGLGHVRLARIVIGTGFDWMDILCYFAGCTALFLFERSTRRGAACCTQ